MTDFQERLSRAAERGRQSRDNTERAKREKAMTEEEFKRMHQPFRLELGEHIESCVAQLTDQFPGFRYETVVGDRGWGAACSRDDVGVGSDGKRSSFYSRLEMAVRPIASYNVLEMSAKGTIRNREVFDRTHFQKLVEVDLDSFRELVDLWVLEYAELYAARQR
ncbi:MAG: hypothetical protein WBF93_00300 [Pirellulales bacterium]